MADNSFSDGVPSDSTEAAKNTSNAEKLTDQVMQNPQVLAALQERLDSVSHTPSSYIETLPKAVKRRINALKQLQVKCAHIEAKFYEEVHDLERKYAALYQPLFDKRREFITGDVEPTDAESEWHSDDEEEEKLAGDMKSKLVTDEKEEAAAEEPTPRGIPEFWFTIFRNVDMLSELVREYDEPILKHLQDIKVKFSDPGQPMSFVLEFHFEPNDYFTNSVLTKTYKMKSEPDKADPFSFEGPEIVDCDGCTIDWKKGKNVTVKTVRKKQKHRGRGTVRTITKQVPSESFFNFFSPLKASGDGESLDEDSEFTLASDFEIGHFFRERIVPRAVLYFTGRPSRTTTTLKRARKVKRRNWKETRRETRRTMPTPTLRCNFCLLIIHAFLERAQPASGVQTAVRRPPRAHGRGQDPACVRGLALATAPPQTSRAPSAWFHFHFGFPSLA